MKRVLSLVLALVMVFGTIMPAFAEDAVAIAAASQAATDLESYGLIAGTDKGLEEDQPLLRSHMAVIYAKMFGKAAEAEAYAFDPTFTDASDDWYTPWIAYAEIQGWMVGDGAGTTFRPNDYVSVQEINTLMVKALGHEVTWATVNADAAALGVVVEAADETLALRGEIFATIRGALDLNSKDATESLGTTLALTGYVAPEPPTPAALEVVSVTALNLIQVEVVFNQEVDATSAAKVANYSLTDVTAGAVAVADAAVQSDGKTVVLTLDVNAAQQDLVDVTIKDVVTASELVVADTTIEDVLFLDMTIPTVVGAEVVGNDTIKVIFSEPMNGTNKANFEVNDGKKLYIKDAKLQNNGTEALVELYSALSEGDLTIKVLATTADYAAFGVTVVTETVTVVEDADAPVVIGYKDATPNGVTLIWSEDLEIKSADKAGFYHTNSNNPIDADLVDADIDGAEMTLKFTKNELPQGTAYVYVLKEKVNDLWNNKNAQQMIAVEVTLDVTAPEVDGDVTVSSETEIKINFTEDMDADSVNDEDNYTLLDSDGEEVDIISSVTDLDSDTIKVTFNKDLSGVYSIILTDLEDLVGNEIADVTLQFEVDDLTPPVAADFTATIYNPGIADQMIRINFKDVMAVDGAYSILDAAKYAFNDNVAMEDLDPDLISFTVVNDGKSVEIVVPSVIDDTAADNGTDYAGVNLDDGKTIVIGKIADAAGNVTPGVSVTMLAAAIADESVIAAPSVKATAVDTIVMTFDQEVSKLELADFQVWETAGVKLDLASVYTTLNADGNTVVTFTLDEELTAIAESDSKTVEVKAITTVSENAYGENISGFPVVALDKIAPSVDAIVFVNDTTIEVQFDEALNGGLFAGGLDGFSVSGGTLLDVVLTTTTVVTLTGDADFTANTNVSYSDVFGLEDLTAGNAIASFDETDALTAAKITVVNAVADNDFTVTNNYETVDVIATADIDMDADIAAAQATVDINGITYTAAAVAGTVTITADAADTATAAADATTANFTITMDGHTETVTMNIAALALGANGVDPTIAGQ